MSKHKLILFFFCIGVSKASSVGLKSLSFCHSFSSYFYSLFSWFQNQIKGDKTAQQQAESPWKITLLHVGEDPIHARQHWGENWTQSSGPLLGLPKSSVTFLGWTGFSQRTAPVLNSNPATGIPQKGRNMRCWGEDQQWQWEKTQEG